MKPTTLTALLLFAVLRLAAQSCDSSFAVQSFGRAPGDSLYHMILLDAPGELDSLAAGHRWKLPCMDWEHHQWHVLAYCPWCLRCGEGRIACHRNACITTWEFSAVPR